jgi:hypothetical protein
MKPPDRTFVKIDLPVTQTVQRQEFKMARVTLAEQNRQIPGFLRHAHSTRPHTDFSDKGRDVGGFHGAQGRLPL